MGRTRGRGKDKECIKVDRAPESWKREYKVHEKGHHSIVVEEE